MRASDIISAIESFAPLSIQESWDNSGLLLGDPEKQVKTVAVALDTTRKTVEAAKKAGAEMMVTHHPVIFSALKKITAGSVVYDLLTSGISVISAHTCWDSAQGGVNDTLASLLGFENVKPIELEGTAMARVAEVEPMTGEELATLVKNKLGCHLRLADSGKKITKVALCGGSASSLVYEAIGKADAFITGDLSHHVFLDAADSGMTVIAAGHFETENPSMKPLTEKLKEKFTDVDFVLIEQENPVKYY